MTTINTMCITKSFMTCGAKVEVTIEEGIGFHLTGSLTDSAVKECLLRVSTALMSRGWKVPGVVNCFQIFYLCSSNTTKRRHESKAQKLWIAFRFFIFVLRTQQVKLLNYLEVVVNCFQIFYLCSSNTTTRFFAPIISLLWIAFRFFIFVLRTQQSLRKTKIAKHLWRLFHSKKVRKKSELFYY